MKPGVFLLMKSKIKIIIRTACFNLKLAVDKKGDKS